MNSIDKYKTKEKTVIRMMHQGRLSSQAGASIITRNVKLISKKRDLAREGKYDLENDTRIEYPYNPVMCHTN